MSKETGVKINKNTGVFVFSGIEVRQGMTVDDFRKYRDSVRIHELGNGDSVIRINNPVRSNGVDGYVIISIANWTDGGMEIEIDPTWKDNELKGTLEASKQWLLGILDEKDFLHFNDLVQANFPWGYILVQYYSNKDYDEYGGNIEICFKDKD